MVTLSCNKNEMTQWLKLIRSEEEYTDVNIIAEGLRFPCHRAFLSAVSPFFKKLLNDVPPWEKDLSISLAETSFEDLTLALTLLYEGEIVVSMFRSLRVMELVNFLDLPCFKCKSKIDVLPHLPPVSRNVNLEKSHSSVTDSTRKVKKIKSFKPKIMVQKMNDKFIQETGAGIWRCEICEKVHNSWLLLSLHNHTQCGTKVPSMCEECQSEIKSYPEFVLHNVEHKVSHQRMCPICLSTNLDNIEQHLVSSGHVAKDMFLAPYPLSSHSEKFAVSPSKRKRPLLRPQSKQVVYSQLFMSSSEEELSEPETASLRRKYRRNSVSTGHFSMTSDASNASKLHPVGASSIQNESVEAGSLLSTASSYPGGSSVHKVHVPKPSSKCQEPQIVHGLKDKSRLTSQVLGYKPRPKSKQVPIQAMEYKPQPKSKQVPIQAMEYKPQPKSKLIMIQASQNKPESISIQINDVPVDRPTSQVLDCDPEPNFVDFATSASRYEPKQKSKQTTTQVSSYKPKPKSKQITTQASGYKPKPKSKQLTVYLPKTEYIENGIEAPIDLIKPKLETLEIQTPTDSPRPTSEKLETPEAMCMRNCVYCGLPAKPYYVHMSRCSKRYFVPVKQGEGTGDGDFRCNVCDKITGNRHLHYKDHHSADRLASLETPLPITSIVCPSGQRSGKENENDKETICDLENEDIDIKKALTGIYDNEDIVPVLEDLGKTTYESPLTSARRRPKADPRGQKYCSGWGRFFKRSLSTGAAIEFSSDPPHSTPKSVTLKADLSPKEKKEDEEMVGRLEKEIPNLEKALTSCLDNNEDNKIYVLKPSRTQKTLYGPKRRRRKENEGDRGMIVKFEKEDGEINGELEKEEQYLEEALTNSSNIEEEISHVNDSCVGVMEVQITNTLNGSKRRRHKEYKEDEEGAESEKEDEEIVDDSEKEFLEEALSGSYNNKEDNEILVPYDSTAKAQKQPIAKKIPGPKTRPRGGRISRKLLSSHHSTSVTTNSCLKPKNSALPKNDDSIRSLSGFTNAQGTCDESDERERALSLVRHGNYNSEELASQVKDTEKKVVGEEVDTELNLLTNETSSKETRVSTIKDSNTSLVRVDPVRQMLTTAMDMLLNKPVEFYDPSTSADLRKKQVTILDLPKPCSSTFESILSKRISQEKQRTSSHSNLEFEVIDLEKDENASSSSAALQVEDQNISTGGEINIKVNISEDGRSCPATKCHRSQLVADSGTFNSPENNNDTNRPLIVLDLPTALSKAADDVQSTNCVKTQVPIRAKAFAQLPKIYTTFSDRLHQILDDSILRPNPLFHLVKIIGNENLEPNLSTVPNAQVSSTLSCEPSRPPPCYNEDIHVLTYASLPHVKQRVSSSVQNGKALFSVSDTIKNTDDFVKLPTLASLIPQPQTLFSNSLGVSVEEPMEVMPSTLRLQSDTQPPSVKGSARKVSKPAVNNQMDTEEVPEVLEY